MINVDQIIMWVEYYFIGMFVFVIFIGIIDGILEENSDFSLKLLLLYPIHTVYSVSKIISGILFSLIKK